MFHKDLFIGPLRFMLHMNDFCIVSNILKPIMFAGDTNLFSSHKSITELFYTVNSKLNKVFAWFNANKPSLDKDKTKLHLRPALIHKAVRKENISFKLPSLFITEKEMKQVSSSKFLGIMLDEHLPSKMI